MQGRWRDPYGSFLPALLYADWQDRRRGDTARVAARWGYLRRPADRAKLLWLQCGSDDASIDLGSELATAIHDRRHDVQLVLTVERAAPLVETRLQGLPRTAWGYAPSDRPAALARAFTRLDPFALIFCGVAPRPNMAQMTVRVKHVLAVAPPACAHWAAIERIYPASDMQARACERYAQAERADMQTIMIEAQVDPNLVTLVNGAHSRHLWWLHSTDACRAAKFAREFGRRFADDVLFVSGAWPEMATPISRWDRSVLAPGSIIAIDEGKWLPAIAASVTATHLESAAPRVLWQAMAGGAAVIHDGGCALPAGALAAVLGESREHAAVFATWQRYRDDPILQRKHADAARRAFWDERRRAVRVNEELLARVFAW